MTLAERVAEIEATIQAILGGASGWPQGLWDPSLRRLEATAEALIMSDEHLAEMSREYQGISGAIGATGQSMMIELARRSTLTAHQRLAEADERRRARG